MNKALNKKAALMQDGFRKEGDYEKDLYESSYEACKLFGMFTV